MDTEILEEQRAFVFKSCIMPRGEAALHFCPESAGSLIPLNTGKHLPHYVT
jgi:hypothetical protein